MLFIIDKKGLEEAAKRLKLEAVKREEIMPELRTKSRWRYLEKRKEDKMQEVEQDLLDDERLFNEDE